MKNTFFYEIKEAVKYWWVSLLIGILAIIVGIVCLVQPAGSFIALAYVFVIAMIASGIFEIIFATSNRKLLYGWGWSLAAGIMEILLAIFILALPTAIMAGILIYAVAFWILFRAIWTIGESFTLQSAGARGWGWLLTLGILTILFSVLFFISPIFGAAFMITFIGIALLFYGIYRIYLAFELRSIHKRMDKIDKK